MWSKIWTELSQNYQQEESTLMSSLCLSKIPQDSTNLKFKFLIFLFCSESF
uniref:Uncharacterized protein n=1 Tax=Megaselia scalaris TaxID=36166 RepID=T1GJL8_MEGSC